MKRNKSFRMNKERNAWEMISDILQVIQDEKKAKMIEIIQGASLDWRNFRRHFDYLIKENLIVKCESNPECYELTESGEDLLTKLNEVGKL
jgi:predicted transcriptional regulator